MVKRFLVLAALCALAACRGSREIARAPRLKPVQSRPHALENTVACVNDPPPDAGAEREKYYPHPLARLAWEGDAGGVAAYLKTKGANTYLESKNYALHAAAEKGQAPVITLLLQAGADPNACGLYSQALHKAVAAGSKAGAGALLAAGAKPLAPDHEGRTPAALAKAMDRQDLVELLNQAVSGRP